MKNYFNNFNGSYSYGQTGPLGSFGSGNNKFLPVLCFIYLIVIAILQPTLINRISIFGITPDLFLVFVILAALAFGKPTGVICGFFFGLTLDFLTGRLIGVNGILYMYAGLFAGILNDNISQFDGLLGQTILTASIAFTCGFLYLLAYTFAFGNPGFFFTIIRLVLPKSLYTAVFAFILSVPINKSFGLITNKNRY